MRIRSLLILPAVLMCAACGGRSDQSATASPAPAGGSYSPATTMSGSGALATGPAFTATVIAIDPAGGSVTLREFVAGAPAGGTGDLRAGDRTLITEGEAKTGLPTLKTGEQVMVTCRAPASGTAAPIGGGLGACEAVITLAPAPR